MSDNEKEFQLDLLKIQMRHQVIFSSYTAVLSIAVSIFISMSLMFLTIGFTFELLKYQILGLIFLVVILPIIYLINRYFNNQKLKIIVIKEIENEFKEIYDKYILLKNYDEAPKLDNASNSVKKNDDRIKEILDKFQKISVLFLIVNFVLAVVNFGMVITTHNMNNQWIQYQTQFTNYTPYVRVETDLIELDNRNIAQSLSGSVHVNGYTTFLVSVITPKESVIEISVLNFTSEGDYLNFTYDGENEVLMWEPIIEELPAGLSKFQLEVFLDGRFRPYDRYRPDPPQSRGIRIGKVFFEVELEIIPTGESIIKIYSAYLMFTTLT